MPLIQLERGQSPYLLQQKISPVHWTAWADVAFAGEKPENEPILLSIGYTTYQWWNVMAHEGF